MNLFNYKLTLENHNKQSKTNKVKHKYINILKL